jgi:hypothetical protein
MGVHGHLTSDGRRSFVDVDPSTRNAVPRPGPGAGQPSSAPWACPKDLGRLDRALTYGGMVFEPPAATAIGAFDANAAYAQYSNQPRVGNGPMIFLARLRKHPGRLPRRCVDRHRERRQRRDARHLPDQRSCGITRSARERSRTARSRRCGVLLRWHAPPPGTRHIPRGASALGDRRAQRDMPPVLRGPADDRVI